MELGGPADLEESIAAVREGLGHDVAVTAVLACRVGTSTTLARDVIDHLRKQPTPAQEPVITDDPSSASAADCGAAGAELQEGITP